MLKNSAKVLARLIRKKKKGRKDRLQYRVERGYMITDPIDIILDNLDGISKFLEKHKTAKPYLRRNR